MDIKVKENIIKIILWKEVFAIPTYTVLFNHFKLEFWVLFIIDRLIVLAMIAKSINIEKLIEYIFENNNSELIKLAIFSVICSIVLYIITFIKNKPLFYILIVSEMADYIVTKILDR
ncbi:hypothetical protein [Romboutsia sp.]|uniref:hypothetical protein n=1 Tax=Romboutsia sp. TaxID=1965302 RepID=UPI002BBAFD32|nr:hypothetical protein [Romboutsia sp.]HSQ89250.1 hypothetical protein [Romboutsia sp.]